MRWTPEQYRDYCVRRAQTGTPGVCPTKPERPEGVPLDSAGQREGKGRTRVKIRFTVYAVRPLDWDNYRLKDLQDCLVRAGLLDGDEWDVLEGSVVSKKAHSAAEEKTVVEIELS